MIPVNAILNVTSLTTGAKLSVKSIPGTRRYPSATSLALYLQSLLILNTLLHPMSFLSFGTSIIFVSFQTLFSSIQ